MATKSFTIEQRFNQKSAAKLLSALDVAQKKNIVLAPPHNVKTIRIQDKGAMRSFINKTFDSSGDRNN